MVSSGTLQRSYCRRGETKGRNGKVTINSTTTSTPRRGSDGDGGTRCSHERIVRVSVSGTQMSGGCSLSVTDPVPVRISFPNTSSTDSSRLPTVHLRQRRPSPHHNWPGERTHRLGVTTLETSGGPSYPGRPSSPCHGLT